MASPTIKKKSEEFNSYTKCIDSLTQYFPAEYIAMAKNIIQKHDRNSFDETVVLSEIFSEERGVRRSHGRRVLRVKGTYQYLIIAHVKQIEMSVETILD